MGIVGYARVSKIDLERNPNALAQQKDRLDNAGCTEIFEEKKSASKGNRPVFKRLMQMVRDHEINHLVVTRVDRLGRTKEISDVYQIFIDTKAKLDILDSPIDLTTSAGRFHANMLAELAILEGEQISERSQHGWAFLRKNEVAMHPPFGYRKNPETKKHELDTKAFLCLLEDRPKDYLLVGKSEWTSEDFENWQREKDNPSVRTISRSQAARNLVDLYLETQSLRRTIRTFNRRYGIQKFTNERSPYAGFADEGVFQRSPSGLAKWLINPVLRGHLTYLIDDPTGETKKNSKGNIEKAKIPEPKYNTHPDQALITEAEYRQIQTIMKTNRERKGFGRTERVYPLSGLVKCGACGSTCYSNKASKKGSDGSAKSSYGYYYCKNANLGTCDQKNYIRMDEIESRLLKWLIIYASEIQGKAEAPIEEAEDPRILEKLDEIEQLEPLRYRPNIKEEIILLHAEIEELRGQKQQIQIDVERKREILQTLVNEQYWQDLTDDRKFFIYRDLIEKIEVKPADWQSVAKTNNKLKKRQKQVEWDIEFTLTFDQRANKTLSESITEFVAFKRDTLETLPPPEAEDLAEDVIIRPLSELKEAMRKMFNIDPSVENFRI